MLQTNFNTLNSLTDNNNLYIIIGSVTVLGGLILIDQFSETGHDFISKTPIINNLVNSTYNFCDKITSLFSVETKEQEVQTNSAQSAEEALDNISEVSTEVHASPISDAPLPIIGQLRNYRSIYLSDKDLGDPYSAPLTVWTKEAKEQWGNTWVKPAVDPCSTPLPESGINTPTSDLLPEGVLGDISEIPEYLSYDVFYDLASLFH